MQVSDHVLAHELDAAWIIALWKAIHGGDPAPEAVAAQIIAILAPYLNESQPERRPSVSLSFSELETQFANFGIHIIDLSEGESPDALDSNSCVGPAYRGIRQYCFQFGRQTVCTQLPNISHRETAA